MPKKVLITRPLAQNQALVDAVAGNCMVPVVLPLMLIEPLKEVDDLAVIDALIKRLADFSAVIFTSTNAAKLFLDRLFKLGVEIPIGQKWHGIGSATTQVLSKAYSDVEDNAIAMNSEALLAKPTLTYLQGQQLLICRGQGGRHLLRDALSARGAKVSYCELYKRQLISHSKGQLAQLINDGLDVLTVTSGETLQALVEQAKLDNVFNKIKVVQLIVPSLRVEQLAQQQGFANVVVADNAGTQAMLQALNL